MIRGSVDTISKKVATGWIYSDADRNPLSVEALINDQLIGRAVANLLRADLKAAGFGEGKCGFELRFNSEVDPIYLPFVQVRLAGTDLEIRRWAGAGFREFFGALYQRHPRAGRSASVFGGLWTDRSDAAALLKGRLDVGTVGIGEANHLARFVQDGVVLLTSGRGESQPDGQAFTGSLVDTVAHNLFGEEILRVLRAIFDDHPVAINASVLEADETDFGQVSALEELPSPAECLGVVFPMRATAVAVDVVRDGHRLPEFLPDGLSRWTHAASSRTAGAVLTHDMPVARYQVRAGSVLLIGPGALCRVRASSSSAVKVLALPARQSLLRFQQTAPRGEVTHASGARVWV
jgi:hypothetical protein